MGTISTAHVEWKREVMCPAKPPMHVNPKGRGCGKENSSQRMSESRIPERAVCQMNVRDCQPIHELRFYEARPFSADLLLFRCIAAIPPPFALAIDRPFAGNGDVGCVERAHQRACRV